MLRFDRPQAPLCPLLCCEKMAKFSCEDKLRIQTLRELGWGAKRIRSAFAEKRWSLSTIKSICRRVDSRGSACVRKPGSGRKKSSRTAANCQQVAELICSQDSAPGTSKSTGEIASQLGISKTSVWEIATKDLGLRTFKRVPAQVINAATCNKRLTRCTRLLQHWSPAKLKKVFFTDEKVFYLDPPVNSQTMRVWASGRKRDVAPQRLLKQRAKFSQHVMVSAGVCYGGKGRLHFVEEKAKVNATYYVQNLLPLLLDDCHNLLHNDFVFQQDGAPAHTARQTQQFLQQHCPEFLAKDEWPPNSPDLNPLDFHVWGVMLRAYEQLQPKPTTVAELRVALQRIWDSLPEQHVQKAILSVRKRLRACVSANGGHFEHLLP